MAASEIIIGTNNQYRFKNIKEQVSMVNPDLVCRQEVLDIPETGDSVEENTKLKLNAYHQVFHGITICADDGITLTHSQLSPGEKLNRDKNGSRMTNQQIINYWNKVLPKEGLEGELIKCIGVITNDGNKYIDPIKYTIKLMPNFRFSLNINPLNNFIYPTGYDRPISNLTKEELKKFRQKQFTVLKNLLICI